MPKCQWSGIGRFHTHFSINKTFYIIQYTCKEKFLRTVSALWCVVACQCVNNFTGPSHSSWNHQLPPAFQSYSSPPINTYNYHPQPPQYPTHILSSILCSVFTGVGMCLCMYMCACVHGCMHTSVLSGFEVVPFLFLVLLPPCIHTHYNIMCHIQENGKKCLTK